MGLNTNLRPPGKIRVADFVCLFLLIMILPSKPSVLSLVAPCAIVLIPADPTNRALKLARVAVILPAVVYAAYSIATETKTETSTVLLTLASAATLDSWF